MSYAPIPGSQTLAAPTNISAYDIDCNTIEAKNGFIQNLTATTFNLSSVSSGDVTANNVTVANNTTTNSLNVTTSVIAGNAAFSTNVTTNTLTVTGNTVSNSLVAGTTNLGTLTVSGNTSTNNLTVVAAENTHDLTVSNNATIQNATITNATITNATITNLSGGGGGSVSFAEGTFTPIVTHVPADKAVSYTTQRGAWAMINNRVMTITFQLEASMGGSGGSEGIIALGGFPAQMAIYGSGAGSTNVCVGVATVGNTTSVQTDPGPYTLQQSPTDPSAWIVYQTNGNGIPFQTTQYIRFSSSFSYLVQ
jgi:hypothetical protein